MKKKILFKHSSLLVLVLFFTQVNLFANTNIIPCGATTTWNGTIWDNGTPDITKSAVFTANYSITSDFTACSISVTTNSVVTINAGVNVTLENEVNVEVGSNLVFENTASLLQNNAIAVNVGSINYKRDSAPMRGGEYTYWGSPVSGQILNIFSPLTSASRFHSFNANSAVNNWVNEAGTSPMLAGKGYAIRAPSNFTTTPQTYNGEFIGTPNNGNVVVNVEGYDLLVKNYNFIGNPYPSAIDVVTMIDNTNLGTLYFWTHNTAISANVFTTDDYAVRTRTTGTAAISGGAVPDQYVAAGQGFFVSAATTTSINFTNAMRVGSNNNQFYRAPQTDPLNYYYHLNLTNTSGAFKQIAVGYQEGATNAYDFGADALGSTEGVVQFYTLIPPATYGFGIQARAYPWTLTDVIPLGYSTTVAGDFDIAIDHNNVFFDDKDIFIEDTSNGTFFNLKTGTFTFTAAVGTFNDRFKLHYEDLSLSIENNIVPNSSVVIYKDKEIINFQSNVLNFNSIKVFDSTGRIIWNEEAINSNTFEKVLAQKSQLIFVEITLENGQKIRRKIIL
jgi:hypothetical protein